MAGFFPHQFLRENEKNIEDKFQKNTGTKARLVLSCERISIDLKTGEETKKEAKFYSNFHEIYAGNDFQKIILEMFGRILENMDNYTAGKSNWRFEKIIELEVAIEEMIHGEGVGNYIPIPPEIANKKAKINPKNDDDKCLLYCIAISRKDKKSVHPERITPQLREEIAKFNIKGMKFPVEMRDIDIFEKKNISIHVFGWNGRIYTHRKPKKKDHVYLLMLTDQGKQHFCLVKNLSRLLRKKENQRKAKRFYCNNCLNWRSTKELLEKHKKFCEKQKLCETFPPLGKIDG